MSNSMKTPGQRQFYLTIGYQHIKEQESRNPATYAT